MSALFKIGYGLYVVTTREGEKDNGLIVNTVMQLTDNPVQVAVTVNKSNYSHKPNRKLNSGQGCLHFRSGISAVH